MYSGGNSQREENREVKRKRIARACHMCQKKKIRCDGNMPACTHCLTHKTDCVFTQIQKRRGSRKGAKYIEALEERLGKMESLLNRSGLLADEQIGKTGSAALDAHLANKSNGTISRTIAVKPISPTDSNNDIPTLADATIEVRGSNTSPCISEGSRTVEQERDGDDYSRSPKNSIAGASDMMNSLGSDAGTETRCIGSSAGFSIFSPKGIQWVIEKTGNTTFKETIYAASLDESRMDYWKSDSFSSIFSRPVFRQLPPKAETLALVKDFFKDFNSVCPLFYQPTFIELVERQFSREPPDSVGWWASLNVVIAITFGLQALNNAPPAINEKAWDYMRNALAVLTELTIRSTDLYAVQALLGMALFMQGTADPRPTAFLVASAMRLSHTLGLHKNESGLHLDPMEAEQRRRVFWIAYRIDKDLCIRSGLPLIQDDDDMNLDLPSEDPEDGFGNMTLSDGQGKINIFRLMAEFAVIEARVHKQLYSTKASKQSDEELLITIGELDHQLEEWKESIPIDFQPEYEIKVTHIPLSLHIIVLHFAYYNCLNTIHRTSVHHSYWTSRASALHGLDSTPLNPRVFSSAALCSSAARASIRLIRYVPIRDLGFVWRVLYFPVSALITLFANILETPTDPRARSDLRLMGSFVEFLSKIEHDNTGEVKRIFRVCSEFGRIAKDVVDKAERDSHSRRDSKRSAHGSEMGKRPSTSRSAVPLTPESTTVGSSGLAYKSPPMYNNNVAARASDVSPRVAGLTLTELQNFASTLDGSGLGSNQFSQHYPALMGSTLNPYAEVQPLFPNGLTMPWNGDTFHGSFAPESFAASAYDFGVELDG